MVGFDEAEALVRILILSGEAIDIKDKLNELVTSQASAAAMVTAAAANEVGGVSTGRRGCSSG